MKNTLILLIQIILNIFLVNLTVTLALLGIHEISHVIIGMQIGCTNGRAVLLDTMRERPYTELFCPSKINNSFVFIGGFLVSIAFGSMFLLLRNSVEKKLFFIILGFSLLFSSLDILMITGIETLFYFSVIIGFLIVAFGECSLIFEYIKREKIFYKNYLLTN